MNSIDKLASMNWTDYRMVPVGGKIVAKSKKENINNTYTEVVRREFDRLVAIVENLSKTFMADPMSYSSNSMSRIAENCWKYLNTRARITPQVGTKCLLKNLAKCNQIYIECLPNSPKNVTVAFQDTEVTITEAETNILRRESSLLATESEKHGLVEVQSERCCRSRSKEEQNELIDLREYNINEKTLKAVIDSLCSSSDLDIKKHSISSYFDLLTAASLLKIEHLVNKCLKKFPGLSDERKKSIDVVKEVCKEIHNFKLKDEKNYQDVMIQKSFHRIVQYLVLFYGERKFYNCEKQICGSSLFPQEFEIKKDISEELQIYMKEFPRKEFTIGWAGNYDYCSTSIFGPGMPPELEIFSQSLEKLTIKYWKITKEGLEQLLKHQKNLKEISFMECHFESDALEVLSKFELLESIAFQCSYSRKFNGDWRNNLISEVFKSLGKCEKLTHLSLSDEIGIKDKWLGYLGDLKINSLKLHRVNTFTGEGLEHLKSEYLTELQLSVCWGLTKEGMDNIHRFKNLTHIIANTYKKNNQHEQEDIHSHMLGIVEKLPKIQLCSIGR